MLNQDQSITSSKYRNGGQLTPPPPPPIRSPIRDLVRRTQGTNWGVKLQTHPIQFPRECNHWRSRLNEANAPAQLELVLRTKPIKHSSGISDKCNDNNWLKYSCLTLQICRSCYQSIKFNQT